MVLSKKEKHTLATLELDDKANTEANEGEKLQQKPDGGWGWVVVFCSFLIHATVDGVTYTFGIFYVEFLRHFGESKAATSWIISIMFGTTYCVGPFASGLTAQFGCRTVAIMGSLLATFGLVASAFAPSVTFLYFSVGLITGTGFGFLYFTSLVCVMSYFEKKRAFATGIAVCGSGVGTFLLAPLTEKMVKIFGWQGAMFITAGIVLNCCVFGALLRPPAMQIKKKKKSAYPFPSDTPYFMDIGKESVISGNLGTIGEIFSSSPKAENLQYLSAFLLSNSRSQIQNTTNSCGEQAFIPQNKIPDDIISSFSVNSFMENQNKENSKATEIQNLTVTIKIFNFFFPPVMKKAFKEMMNFRLMRNFIFIMYGFSNFFFQIGLNATFIYTKDRAIELEIADDLHASYLMSVIGIANTIGRVAFGYISDCRCLNRLWLNNVNLFLCGFTTAFSSMCRTYSIMAINSTLFGLTSGGYACLSSVILVDLVGQEKVSNGYGLLLIFIGLGGLTGPPMLGSLHDYSGSYDLGFYVSGGIINTGAFILCFIPCAQKITNNRNKS